MIRTLLSALALIIFTLPAFAGNVEVGSDGSLRIGSTTSVVWKGTGITVSEEAVQYPQWEEAFKNPDSPISVGRATIKYDSDGFYLIATLTTKQVVYDPAKKTIALTSDTKTERSFNMFFIFAIIALVSMAVLNVTSRQQKLSVVVASLAIGATGFATFTVAIFIFFGGANFFGATAAATAVASTLFLVIYFVEINGRMYRFALRTSFVLMLISCGLTYFGI